jgi:hypothetical protein
MTSLFKTGNAAFEGRGMSKIMSKIMSKMKATLIVEGDGEVEALPLIWRSLCPSVPLISPPYRLARSRALDHAGNVKAEEWKRAFQLLQMKGAACVLAVMDADDICPKQQAPIIKNNLESLSLPIGLKLGFCLAEPEYEGWFLAGADFLDLGSPVTPPLPRDCKGEVKRRLEGRYSPVVDQPSLTSKLLPHLKVVAARSSSLDKLIREIESLCPHELLLSVR